MSGYYLMIDGQKVGPSTGDQVLAALAKGEVNADGMAWDANAAQWVRIGNLVRDHVATLADGVLPDPPDPSALVREHVGWALEQHRTSKASGGKG